MRGIAFFAALICTLLNVSLAVAADQPFTGLPKQWRMTGQDDPAFAAADFDDSAWRSFELQDSYPLIPRAAAAGEVVWFRTEMRDVDFRGEVAITLGFVMGAYELFIDGESVAVHGEPGVRAPSNLPVAHRVPAEALRDGRLVIAVRTWLPAGVGQVRAGQRLMSAPRVLAAAPVVDLFTTRAELLAHKRWTMNFIFIALFELLLCLYHLHLWRGRRELSPYLWYGLAMGSFAISDGTFALVGSTSWFTILDFYAVGPITQGLANILVIEFVVRFASGAAPSRRWRAVQGAHLLLALGFVGLGLGVYELLPIWAPQAVQGGNVLLLAGYASWAAFKLHTPNARGLAWAMGIVVTLFILQTQVPALEPFAMHISFVLNVALAVVLSNHYGRTWDDLRSTNRAIVRFVPSPFLELLGRNKITEVTRGDSTAIEMAIMFSDIRGFTTMAESMGPQKTFSFINDYLGRMDPEIHKQDGFINDIFGDGIMALFHKGADAAVAAAIGMLRATDEFDSSLRMGVGIHTGELMLGTIGGSERLDCTVVGDPANTASRIEGMTKMYGAALLISEATYQALEDPDAYDIRPLDRVIAKGKDEPSTIYEVLDGERDARRGAKPSDARATTLSAACPTIAKETGAPPEALSRLWRMPIQKTSPRASTWSAPRESYRPIGMARRD